MFNEILKGVTEFLGFEPPYLKKMDATTMHSFLHLRYNNPNYFVTKVTRIKIEKIPDIILVAITGIDTSNIRICDYMFYEGELVKIITFSMDVYQKSDANRIGMTIGLFGDINNSLIDSYSGYDKNPNFMNSFVEVLLYAPFLMSVAYIQNNYPFVNDNFVSTIFTLLHPAITKQSIKSAKKLITDFTVSDLLDKGIWFGVTNEEYPDIKYLELKPNTDTVKSKIPGKGVWDLNNMEEENKVVDDDKANNKNDKIEYEYPFDEINSFEDADDEYPFNEIDQYEESNDTRENEANRELKNEK